MGKWDLRKFYKKFPIHPSFVLLFFWFVITNNYHSFLLFTVVVLTHEFGHYLVAKKCGYKLDYFYITPYGISLNYKEKAFENRDEILIALAGPFVNLCLSLIIVSLWWIFPSMYGLSYEFVFQSVMLALFNLIPCYPLDGGRIFCGLLSKNMPRKKAVDIICIFNYIFSAIFFILFIFSCFYNFNPTFLLGGIFLVLGNIDFKNESKYQPIQILNKKIKNFSHPIFLFIDGEVIISNLLKHIEANKFTIFVVKLKNGQTKILDEDKIKSLAINLSPALSINQVFKQEKE